MRHMRFAAVALAFFIAATASAAATTETSKPDFSRDAILKVLHDAEVEREQAFRMRVGAADYTTRSTRFRFAYLPFFAPLPYSGPQGARFLPNPFVLTGMEFPYAPGQYVAGPLDYERSAEQEREFRRVMKLVAKRR